MTNAAAQIAEAAHSGGEVVEVVQIAGEKS